MKAVLVELPPFPRLRESYLDDEGYRSLQTILLENPEAGDVVPGAGGLRKLRFGDERRGKGKRGGLRVIYYWWSSGPEFWLFTLYDKDEAADLTTAEKKAVRDLIKAELAMRRTT